MYTPRRIPTLASIATTALLVPLAISGCGGGSSGGGLSKKDYISKADAICREIDKKINAIPNPQKVQDVAGFVDKTTPVIDDGIARLEKLEAGNDIKAGAAELLSGLKQQRAVIDDLRAAAGKKDTQAMQQVSAKGSRMSKQLSTQAKRTGFKNCGIDQ